MMILQKQALSELSLDKDLKVCMVVCKGNQTWKLIWAKQAVSGRQRSQVEEPDLRMAFTEPEVEKFSSIKRHLGGNVGEGMMMSTSG